MTNTKTINREYTYSGNIISSNKQDLSNYCIKVALRKTELYWVTVQGTEFNIETGKNQNPWMKTILDIPSIKTLAKTVNAYS